MCLFDRKNTGSAYSENLEILLQREYTGKRTFYITNVDKNFESHEFFYYNDRLTIDEFNFIIAMHHCNIVRFQSDYHSDECVVAEVDFFSRRAVALGGSPTAFSRYNHSDSNDWTMEDNLRLQTRKLYCVSVKRKIVGNHSLFWNHQCVTMQEINHILACHAASVEYVIPIYRTGTEFFVLVNFDDQKVPPVIHDKPQKKPRRSALQALFDAEPEDSVKYQAMPIGHDQIYCITSLRETNMTNPFFYEYNCITNQRYQMILQSYDVSITSECVTDNRETDSYKKSNLNFVILHLNSAR